MKEEEIKNKVFALKNILHKYHSDLNYLEKKLLVIINDYQKELDKNKIEELTGSLKK